MAGGPAPGACNPHVFLDSEHDMPRYSASSACAGSSASVDELPASARRCSPRMARCTEALSCEWPDTLSLPNVLNNWLCELLAILLQAARTERWRGCVEG